MSIHKSAIVHPGVTLPDGVHIGPFSIVEENVELGKDVSIGASCHIYSGSHIGDGTQIWDGAVIGSIPQDLKYKGEKTEVFIGKNCVLREYVTVNKGTSHSKKTLIGNNCYVMAYCHVAHDCSLEEGVVMANQVQMGGHVQIGAKSVILGMTGIHQFTTIAEGCYVGGGLRVFRDIPPFSKALGEPLKLAGANGKALKKFTVNPGEESLIKKIHRQYKHMPLMDFLEWLGGQPQSLSVKSWRAFFSKKNRAALRY